MLKFLSKMENRVGSSNSVLTSYCYLDGPHTVLIYTEYSKSYKLGPRISIYPIDFHIESSVIYNIKTPLIELLDYGVEIN